MEGYCAGKQWEERKTLSLLLKHKMKSVKTNGVSFNNYYLIKSFNATLEVVKNVLNTLKLIANLLHCQSIQNQFYKRV